MGTSYGAIPPGARVLVTGATGFTGSVLVRKLAAMDVDIVAIVRPTSNIEPFRDLDIEWHRGDVVDETIVRHACKGVEYIFHLATPLRESKSPNVSYYNVHVLSTQKLVHSALNQNNFKRFIYVSTIGIHGHVAHPPADENYPTAPGDIYQETKLEGELWIKKFAQQTRLPIVVVRPAGIYGPGDKRLLKIFKWVARGWVPVIGDGNNLLHLIHVDDLTDFMLMVGTHPQAVGEVFICGSQEAITFHRMIDIIGDCYKTPIRLIRFPAAPLFLIGDFCERLCRPFGIEPPVYRRRLAFYTKDRSFNTAKMRNLLGFFPRHGDEEGLRELAQWYLDQGWVSRPKIPSG